MDKNTNWSTIEPDRDAQTGLETVFNDYRDPPAEPEEEQRGQASPWAYAGSRAKAKRLAKLRGALPILGLDKGESTLPVWAPNPDGPKTYATEELLSMEDRVFDGGRREKEEQRKRVEEAIELAKLQAKRLGQEQPQKAADVEGLLRPPGSMSRAKARPGPAGFKGFFKVYMRGLVKSLWIASKFWTYATVMYLGLCDGALGIAGALLIVLPLINLLLRSKIRPVAQTALLLGWIGAGLWQGYMGLKFADLALLTFTVCSGTALMHASQRLRAPGAWFAAGLAVSLLGALKFGGYLG